MGLKRYEINTPVLPVGEESLAVHSTGLLLSESSFTKSTEACSQSQEERLSKQLNRLDRFLSERDGFDILLNLS